MKRRQSTRREPPKVMERGLAEMGVQTESLGMTREEAVEALKKELASLVAGWVQMGMIDG